MKKVLIFYAIGLGFCAACMAQLIAENASIINVKNIGIGNWLIGIATAIILSVFFIRLERS